MHIATRLESRGFRYKVALYLSYLNIRFDDENKGNPYEFRAFKVIQGQQLFFHSKAHI